MNDKESQKPKSFLRRKWWLVLILLIIGTCTVMYATDEEYHEEYDAEHKYAETMTKDEYAELVKDKSDKLIAIHSVARDKYLAEKAEQAEEERLEKERRAEEESKAEVERKAEKERVIEEERKAKEAEEERKALGGGGITSNDLLFAEAFYIWSGKYIPIAEYNAKNALKNLFDRTCHVYREQADGVRDFMADARAMKVDGLAEVKTLVLDSLGKKVTALGLAYRGCEELDSRSLEEGIVYMEESGRLLQQATKLMKEKNMMIYRNFLKK